MSHSAGLSYFGICALCGAKETFRDGTGHSVRESYRCPQCRASLRYRDQACLIVDTFGDGRQLSLAQLVASGLLDDKAIYEPALHGPFVNAFRKLPDYRRSFYWQGLSRGEEREGVPFEDLTDLSLESGSIDLVVTSDVMEHVFEPWKAFAEIARVLKFGGVHIFSIPMAWPPPAASTEKAVMVDGEVVHLAPPRYHRGGDGSDSLVVIDYGCDIIARLRPLGLETRIIRRSSQFDPAYQNATFISQKMR